MFSTRQVIMKYHVVILTLMLPVAAKAQQVERLATREVKVPALSSSQSIEKALRNMANPRVTQLARATVLYRNLRDTTNSHPIKRLVPGDLVVVRAERAQWLVVSLAQSTTLFSSDTTTYYMPKTALKGSKTFIIL